MRDYYNVISKGLVEPKYVKDVINRNKPKVDKTQIKGVVGRQRPGFRPTKFVVAIPHAGSLVSDDCWEHVNYKDSNLVNDIDYGCNTFYQLQDIGAVVIKTQMHRNVVDCNKTKENAINTISCDGTDLLIKPYRKEHIEHLLMRYYDPFIAMVEIEMRNLTAEGLAFLLNGHSMESHSPLTGEKRPAFAIGTNGDRSAEKRIINTFYEALQEYSKELNFEGERVAIDFPGLEGRKGLTNMFGRPKERYNALLLEVNQNLFNEKYGDDFFLKCKISDVISKTMEEMLKEIKKRG